MLYLIQYFEELVYVKAAWFVIIQL